MWQRVFFDGIDELMFLVRTPNHTRHGPLVNSFRYAIIQRRLSKKEENNNSKLSCGPHMQLLVFRGATR